jgi:flagellar biosynthesis/type III secretory pathway protein FliH
LGTYLSLTIQKYFVSITIDDVVESLVSTVWPRQIEAKVFSTDTESNVDVDPFNQVLSLEEQYIQNSTALIIMCRFYKEGYEEGYADGLKSGPAEGYDFGYEVAFRKFLPLGVLLGRCVIWKHSLKSDGPNLPPLSEGKKARVVKLVDELENTIVNIDRGNETEAEHGRFDALNRKIMSKCRIVESMLGEKRVKLEQQEEEEGQLALAKRMDKELQL